MLEGVGGNVGIVGSVRGSERPGFISHILPLPGEKQPQGSVAEHGAPFTRLC